MKRRLFVVYFIFVVIILILMGCELQNEVKPFVDEQEEKEQQKVEQIDYNIVLVSPASGSENISPEGTELVWKAYLKGTTKEATQLTFQVYLSDTQPPKKVLSDSNLNKINSGKLEAGTIYYWKIIAKDKDGKTFESEVWSFKTKASTKKSIVKIVPVSPTDTKEQPNKSITFSWKLEGAESSDATYTLLIDKSKDFSKAWSVETNSGNYIFKEKLEKSTNYFWKVIAKFKNGEIIESETFTFTTVPPSSPVFSEAMPLNDASNLEPVNIKFTWQFSDKDGDNLSYDFYLYESTITSTPLFSETSLFNNSLTLTEKLKYNQIYYWKVIAKDEDNNKVESKISKFTTKLLRDIYVLTPKINATDVPVKNIKFEWEDEKINGVKYIFRIGESKDKMSALPFELTENYCLYEAKLKYDTTYYWRVDRRYQGKLIQGETYQFRTVKLPKPEKLNPVGINKPTKNLVLSWEYPILEMEKIVFDIYLGTDQTALKKIAENVTSTTYAIPERLAKEKTYYWKVIARNAYGICSESEIAEFETIPQTIPNKPTLIEPINDYGTVDFENLKLSWDCKDPDDDELKFLVYLDTTNPPQKLLTETEQREYIIQKLLPNTTYYWQIVAIDEEGKEVVSEINKFTTTKMILYEDFEKEKYVIEKVSAKGLVRIREDPKKGKVLELKAEDGNSSEFSFELNILTPFILKFEYLVSSEEKYDYFLVYINNKQVYKDSGVKNWNVFEIKLDPGQYTIKLVYQKDRIKYEGMDVLLIDNIVVKYSF